MFVAREKELAQLEEAYGSGAFELVVVYGRRRVGKSTLLREFCRGKDKVRFCTARETSASENLRLLSAAILAEGPRDGRTQPSFPTFEGALRRAFADSRDVRTLLVIDEYPYLAQSYPGVSSLLQELVDVEKEVSKLMLVLCGSSMSFMEHQVLGRLSPLYGRRTSQLKVEPFDCFDARLMLPLAGSERIVELYSLVGGVPLYLEQLDAAQTSEWNLSRRMLGLGRFLYAEPENFLLQEVRAPSLYNAVVEAIARGNIRPVDIENACGMKSSAVASYLRTLCELGIVRRVSSVGTTGSKKMTYQICDYLFRFYYTFAPRYSQLVEAGMAEAAARRIAERDLSTYVGHAFEAVCRQWVMRQMASGGIDVLPREVGSWWGADPVHKKSAEVDVAVLGFDGELLVGECKWEARPVGSDVIGRLAHRAELVCPGAKDVHLYLFSKSDFTAECVDDASRRANVTLVTLSDMFGR